MADSRKFPLGYPGADPRLLGSTRKTENRSERGSTALLTDEDWRRIGRHLCLSPRELELVQHIFGGEKLTSIAERMDLSLGTVKTYSQRIHQKLGVNNQRQLTLVILSAHIHHIVARRPLDSPA